jgi:drug/metabolite transporter (DMT)-like permease
VRFAKVVFYIAAVWGMLVLTPLYFMFDVIGRQDPPPITHPAFYYGFAGTALAWQAAFFLIATNPARFRAMMIPAILEKIAFGGCVIVLFLEKRIHPGDLGLASVDLLFAVLFLISFIKTRAGAAALGSS